MALPQDYPVAELSLTSDIFVKKIFKGYDLVK